MTSSNNIICNTISHLRNKTEVARGILTNMYKILLKDIKNLFKDFT